MTAQQQKALSVVIVTYQSWEVLKACLNSLNASKHPTVNLDVIVVDNHPEKPIPTEIEQSYPAFKFIKNSGNHGFAHGCNTGALQAKAPVILFLNPDTRVPANTLETMLNEFEKLPEHSILGCLQRSPKGKTERIARQFPSIVNISGIGRAIVRQFKSKQLKRDFAADLSMVWPDWISGSVVMITRSTLITLNGWDTRYWMYSEDVDLCKRAKNAGGQIALLQSTSIVHDHGGSTRINPEVKALTKTEVKISHHTFISLHHSGFERIAMHSFLLLADTLAFSLSALLSLLYFPSTKSRYQRLRLRMLWRYYLHCLSSGTWQSPRSVGLETRFK